MIRCLAILLISFALLSGSEPTHVTIYLKYYHQFQFAGLYAADSKGFFAEEGITVDIREFHPGKVHPPPLGPGEMAIHSCSFPESWAKGDELFLVAIIFQRNPYVFLVREDSAVRGLGDLPKVPRERLIGPAEMYSAREITGSLTRLGIDAQTLFPRTKQPGDFDRFVRGELEVMPGYSTSELLRVRRLGIAVRQLPLDDRHNLYCGDSLVCSGAWQREQPDVVAAVRRASLRGWAYALSHREEIVDHILTARRSRWISPDRQALLEEADAIVALVDADTYPLGTISRDRLVNLANHLKESGIQAVVRDDLFFHEPRLIDSWFTLLVGGSLAISTCFLLLAAFTRRQHRHLAESRAHYNTLMEMAEGYFAFRLQLVQNGFRPELASPSITAILGHPIEHYQRNPSRFLAQMPNFERKGLAGAVRRTLLLGRALRITLAIRHGTTGERRRVLIHARATRTEHGLMVDGICLDLTAEAQAETQRRKSDRKIQQALRHESLALLAGGVAHDFNNLLGAIRGNTELLKPAVVDDETMLGRWQRLLMAVDRAAGLVRQILAYTGKATVEAKPLDVETELLQLIALLKHGLPPGVAIQEAITTDLPSVLFDQMQFQQVVLNLIVNAAESYQGRPGTVTVSLVRQPGSKLVLRISDLGCGMDTMTQSRMFEPYFTTKEHGHGLGLAAVRGIIAKAGGTLECHSALGKGSTFTITLDCLPDSGSNVKRAPNLSPLTAVRHVLVVDDDPSMRENAAALLRELGYQASTTESGRSCLDLLAKTNAVSAILLDCRMADLDGFDTLRRLRGLGNGIPVLLMSGYPQDPEADLLLAQPRTGFISKPFTRSELEQGLAILLGDNPDDDESSTRSPVSEYVRDRRRRSTTKS